MNGVEIKEILTMMVSGTTKSAKKFKNGDAPERIFLVICENDMLRNGNSGLKMGVSRAAHTQYAYNWKYPPPPPLPGNWLGSSIGPIMRSYLQWRTFSKIKMRASIIPRAMKGIQALQHRWKKTCMDRTEGKLY